MYNLEGAIVSLKFAGVTLKCIGLSGNTIYAYDCRNNNKLAFDVMLGVLADTTEEYDQFAAAGEVHFDGNWNPNVNGIWLRKFEEIFARMQEQDPALRSRRFIFWLATHQTEFRNVILPLAEEEIRRGRRGVKTFKDKNAIRTLTALANHQATGDEITKGLQALNIKPPVTIQRSYLGGWNLKDYTIEQLLEEMFNQRTE